MTIEDKIEKLADKYAEELDKKIGERLVEMQGDNTDHYLIYRVLGINTTEGEKIDIYQNKGRFLYKYAGSFLEEATFLCFQEKFKGVKAKVKIQNTLSMRPKLFEIDCLVGNTAYEIKRRDATTDGDHITKEHTRLKNIKVAGYKPIRIMFYYPNRGQAKRIQETLATIYHGVSGEYYYGNEAWKYIKKVTGVDLLGILEKIANKKVPIKK